MSRTDDLRQHGGKERGGSGGGAPFVKWSDDYAWIEGRVLGTFETKFGLACTIDVERTGGAPLTTQGKDEDGREYRGSVEIGELVNIGLNSATLQGKITEDDKGKVFHVAFEGWEQGRQGGNRYRVFAVVELTERAPATVGGEPEIEDSRDFSHGDPDDDLPF